MNERVNHDKYSILGTRGFIPSLGKPTGWQPENIAQ
jgi:hypothetical protein